MAPVASAVYSARPNGSPTLPMTGPVAMIVGVPSAPVVELMGKPTISVGFPGWEFVVPTYRNSGPMGGGGGGGGGGGLVVELLEPPPQPCSRANARTRTKREKRR